MKNLDNYFNLARATEEKMHQMADKVQTTNRQGARKIISRKVWRKWRGETVNDKLWNLETRMDSMSREQAESSCAIQSKLDALLRNFMAQEKKIPEKTKKLTGTRVDFVEPQCRKQEMTTLLLINNSIQSMMTTMATKGGLSKSTRILRESGAYRSATPDAMTWANTWELMNRTHKGFAARNTESSDRGGGKDAEGIQR